MHTVVHGLWATTGIASMLETEKLKHERKTAKPVPVNLN
jgi:hypothetical protein